MYANRANPDDISFPDNWSHMKCSWDTDQLFEELYDLTPKQFIGKPHPWNDQQQQLNFVKMMQSKLITHFSSSSRKLQLSTRCEESTIDCLHGLHQNQQKFADDILNNIKSYTMYAHEYSNESMIDKYHNKTRKRKGKGKNKIKTFKKYEIKQKRKAQNPLHFKTVLFGPSPSFTICNECITLFYVKSHKLRDLLEFIHIALRSQYIEFKYALNTITWFLCKILLNPLIRRALFNDNFMREYYLELWHKLWVQNKYYYITKHHIDKVKDNKKPTINVFVDILPTMFYNMNFILTMALLNFKYKHINNRFIKNKSVHWQRILAFVVEQGHIVCNPNHQTFMNQDDDMFYHLGNIVSQWIYKYQSKKHCIDHWFDMKGRKNESIDHYQLRSVKEFFTQKTLVMIRAQKNYIEWKNNNPLKNIKTIGNASKSCINTVCKKSGLWYDETSGRFNERKLFICKGCKLVFYCSRKCQKYDWIRGKHNILCKLLQIEYSARLIYQHK